MCCYVMAHICAEKVQSRAAFPSLVCVSVRELHPGRLLGAGAECGKAEFVPRLQLELSFLLLLFLTSLFFPTILDQPLRAQGDTRELQVVFKVRPPWKRL